MSVADAVLLAVAGGGEEECVRCTPLQEAEGQCRQVCLLSQQTKLASVTVSMSLDCHAAWPLYDEQLPCSSCNCWLV